MQREPEAGDLSARSCSIDVTPSGYCARSSGRMTAAQVAAEKTYRIGGAYWIPPLLHSEFSPRGIFSFDPSPTLRS